MTLEEKIKYMEAFANKHGIVLSTEGERECVGYMHGDNYVDHNPINMTTFEDVDGFQSEEIFECAPPSAYHKHNCLCVLLSGCNGDRERALDELYDWTVSLNNLGVEVVDYRTGAVGFQAIVSGVVGKAVRVKR